MNILILNWKDIKNPTAGGAEIVTFEHAKRWVKKGNTVTWLSSAFKGSKKEEDIEGIHFKRFGNIYGVYLYAPYFYLFSGNKFDLVIDEVHGIPFFTPLYIRKPIVVLIHEVAGEIWDYMYGFPFNYLGRALEKIYLKLYSGKKFWTDSESTIDELIKNGIKRSHCVSIPCPSNAPVLTKIPEKKKSVTIVSICRIVKMKGIEDVIGAFSIINKNYRDARLIIIGGGESNYIEYLKENKVKKLHLEGHVDFLGFVSEKKKLEILRKSHLLLHASIKEGWGLVVIEAASQATPSVVYNVPGLSESVKNRITGIVTNMNNSQELGETALGLLEDKKRYRKFQENCLKWAGTLSWEDAANKSLILLKRI